MVDKFGRSDRRILKFPAINPCEDISPVTLLDSLIKIAQNISNSQTKFFPTQRKKARELNRQILILSLFFDEVRANFYSNISYSIILCLSELHLTFQKVQFLLEDCTREGARTWILMKSHIVANQFRSLVRSLSTALDVLPLNSMDISLEIKELVQMLAHQLRKAKMDVESSDEIALKRVILVLNQLENKLEPDPFMVRMILGQLHINTWTDCHKEIKFLEDEIGMAYSDGEEREVPLLSGLLGFLSYCRGILFEDCDFVSLEQSTGRSSNFENLSCLNPEDFRCPISLELMTDPVTVSTGQTYDRVSIQKWLKSGNLICPKTGGKLTSTELVPNTSLKKLIQQFCGEYGVSLTKSRKNSRDLSRTILPGSPANAEAIRFLSQFLALRLSYGSSFQQNKAAYEIRLLAKSNLYNRSCLIEAGTVSPLVEMLSSSDPGIQENAISALLKLSKQPAGQKDIIQNGGLDMVISVIRNGLKPESKQIAAAIIFYLGSVHEQRKVIGEKNGAIPALLELIREGSHCGKKNSVVAIFALLLYHRNRQFVDSASGKTFPTLDPRTGEVITQVAEGDTEDINRAVLAAREAFDHGPWPKMSAYERSRIVFRFADLVEQHMQELAQLETWDSGKPYDQTFAVDLPSFVRLFRYYAGWADKIHGLTVPADGPYHVQVLREPIGVVGQVIPWNFPLLMFAFKVAAALTCGNTVVLKPAEQTPLTALYVAKLFHEAGLPDGVLNVVSGYGTTAGAALARHMDVDKLAFTGSTNTGKIVMELAAKSNLKAVSLELGGKSPFIVCEDADIDNAVRQAHFALFYNQGQCCAAGSRTYVHERVYDEFVEKAKARAMRRRVGDPFKKGTEQGPQIDSVQFEKILGYIRSGIDSDATLECGGGRFGSKGNFIQPTVFSNVQDNMSIAQDEIFGPVQSILKFRDIDEVMKRANSSRYGLAAGVFTKNIDTANTLSRGLKAGTVWVNCYHVFDAAIPFGGFKMSGIGRDKGMESLKNYLQVKAVVCPLMNPAWL